MINEYDNNKTFLALHDAIINSRGSDKDILDIVNFVLKTRKEGYESKIISHPLMKH